MSNCMTYLTFNGNCREAFEFYRSVFGGEFEYIATFDELPQKYDRVPEDSNRIMHVSFQVKGGVIMGSDTSSTTPTVKFGDNFSIYVATASIEETDLFIKKMSEGGTVTMPAENTFWGAYFGMCKDQFGINWMFSVASE